MKTYAKSFEESQMLRQAADQAREAVHQARIATYANPRQARYAERKAEEALASCNQAGTRLIYGAKTILDAMGYWR